MNKIVGSIVDCTITNSQVVINNMNNCFLIKIIKQKDKQINEQQKMINKLYSLIKDDKKRCDKIKIKYPHNYL